MFTPPRSPIGSPRRKYGRSRSSGRREHAPGHGHHDASMAGPQATSARPHDGILAPLQDAQAWDWPAQVRLHAGLQFCGATQHRDLIVHSAFTGMGSHARVLAELGLRFHDVIGADPKQIAQAWRETNNVTAMHCYEDVRHIHTSDIGHAPCGVAGSTHHDHLLHERPDLCFGGFSCLPFTSMRSNRTTVPAACHPEFKHAQYQVDYLMKVQPRGAVLENTLGFGRLLRGLAERTETSHVGEEFDQTGVAWFKQQTQSLYHMAVVELDLCVWVEMRRPRLWMLLVHRDIGAQAAADAARDLALHIQRTRSERPALLVRDFMFAQGSPEWARAVGTGMSGPPPISQTSRPRTLQVAGAVRRRPAVPPGRWLPGP